MKHPLNPNAQLKGCLVCAKDLTAKQFKYCSRNCNKTNWRRTHLKQHNGTNSLWRKNNPDYMAKYYRKFPWLKHLKWIRKRCSDKDNIHYGAKGIKCLITGAELKSLWYRDKADDMSRPSIDRIDSDGHYELSNCRFLELIENIRLANEIQTK